MYILILLWMLYNEKERKGMVLTWVGRGCTERHQKVIFPRHSDESVLQDTFFFF